MQRIILLPFENLDFSIIEIKMMELALFLLSIWVTRELKVQGNYSVVLDPIACISMLFFLS